MESIALIPNNMGKEFLKMHRAQLENLFIRDYACWYALFIDGNIVSVLALGKARNGIKINACYTISEYRGCGHFTTLLRCLLKHLDGVELHTYATPMSQHVFRREGFKEVREFQNGTKYMKKELL